MNHRTTPEWDKAAIALNGGRGVDHVLELGGANTLTLSFGAIRLDGKISLIGGQCAEDYMDEMMADPRKQ